MSQSDLPSQHKGLFPESWVVGPDAAKLAREDDNVLIDSIAERAAEQGFDADAMRAVWHDLAGDEDERDASASPAEPDAGAPTSGDEVPVGDEVATERADVAVEPVVTRPSPGRRQAPSDEELAALHREMDRLREQVRSHGNSLRRLDRRVTDIGSELTALRDADPLPGPAADEAPAALTQPRRRGRLVLVMLAAFVLLALVAGWALLGSGGVTGLVDVLRQSAVGPTAEVVQQSPPETATQTPPVPVDVAPADSDAAAVPQAE